MASRRTRLMRVYEALLDRFGPQDWWPGETPFEIMVGAVLTQNTAWTNVERAVAALAGADALDPQALLALSRERLVEHIRPSGYYNVKAKRLVALTRWYVETCGGDIDRLRRMPLAEARAGLLGVNGVGPETADSILLYAADKPVFVVDAYTRRIFSRLGMVAPDADYETMQRLFMGNLPEDVALFNEYHALIVASGKNLCRPRSPKCADCPLRNERHRRGARDG